MARGDLFTGSIRRARGRSTHSFLEPSMRHLCESGLRENCTSRLSGGRRPAPTGASSDPTPSKRANKGTGVPAEPVEGRASAKGNPRSESTRRTQSRESVTQAAGRIRQAATRKPQEKLTALLHHVTPDALRWAFHALKRDAAAGVDGMTWALYAEGLEERLLARFARCPGLRDRTAQGQLDSLTCGGRSGTTPDTTITPERTFP